MKQRDNWLDSIKFLGTAFIILSHAGCGIPVSRFYYVPIFFIIAGYVFKDTDLKKFIIGKIKRLYIPFVAVNVFYLLFRNFLCRIGISASKTNYTLIQIAERIQGSFIFEVSDIMASATWFVFSLFVTNIVFFVLFKLTKLFRSLQDILLIAIVLLMYVIGTQNREVLNQTIYGNCSIYTITLISMLFYTIGYFAKKYYVINKIDNGSEQVQIILLASSIGVLFLSEYYFDYANSFREGVFSSSVLLLLNTVSGFVFLTFISKKIIPIFNSINTVVSWAGRYSMDMLLWHVAWFQLVTFIQIRSGFDYNKLNLWPNLIRAGNWCYLAAFTGIVGPLLIRYLLERIKTIKK